MSTRAIFSRPVCLPDDAGDGLATDRLILRRHTRDDLPTLVRMNADAEVMQYLGDVLDEQQTRELLERRIIPYYDEHPGFGVWATCLRSTGETIGFHLLNHIRGETLIQVGYRLERQHWGQGYATEMNMALLYYGCVKRGVQTLHGITSMGNTASQQVLLKSGLHRCGDRRFAHPAYAADGVLAFFKRDSGEWLEAFTPGDIAEPAQHGVSIR